jgi:hypothetical protein
MLTVFGQCGLDVREHTVSLNVLVQTAASKEEGCFFVLVNFFQAFLECGQLVLLQQEHPDSEVGEAPTNVKGVVGSNKG